MKKVLSTALMAALMLGMTSCFGNGDEDITRATIDMYNLVSDINDDNAEAVLSKGVTAFEVNYSKQTISANVQASLYGGLPVSFATGILPMKISSNSYVYNLSSVASTGMLVSDFAGALEPNVGMMYNEYVVNSSYKVHSTASYAYNFVEMNVYTADKSKLLYTTDEVAFGFIPECDKEKNVKFVLSGFRAEESSEVISSLSYEKLKYEMTNQGFTVTGEGNNTQGYGSLNVTNVKGEVFEFGKSGKVSFNMGSKYYVEIVGTMFYVPKN